jgi:hypothetical protein
VDIFAGLPGWVSHRSLHSREMNPPRLVKRAAAAMPVHPAIILGHFKTKPQVLRRNFFHYVIKAGGRPISSHNISPERLFNIPQ